MDRFDIAIALNAVDDQALRQTSNNLTTNTTAEIAAGVTAARNRQYQRQAKLNSRLSVQELARVACLDAASERILQHAARQWNWSARSWHRVLRVARTIADIDASSDIDLSHLSQAIELRRAMDAHLLA